MFNKKTKGYFYTSALSWPESLIKMQDDFVSAVTERMNVNEGLSGIPNILISALGADSTASLNEPILTWKSAIDGSRAWSLSRSRK